MRDPAPAASAASQPLAVVRAALGAAATRERGRQARRRDRIAAVAGLSDDDLGRLVVAFDALLRGPGDVAALTDELHAALRALSPETVAEEDRGA
jgi:hypothetical protein